MASGTVAIDTSKINPYRGRAIGKAFYNAYMDFIKNPDNEKFIEEKAAEIRERERKQKVPCEKMST